MINVTLDTSILRQDIYLEKAFFSALKKLCEENVVKLHIPFLVREEFLSQINEHLKPFKEILKNLKLLSNKKLTTSQKLVIDQTEENITTIKSEYEKHITDNFNEWMEAVNAQVHEIKPHHTSKVFESYFKGAPPFKGVKNRSDFPDAYIFEAINELSTELEHLHVIIGDKFLLESCKTLGNISCHESLDVFLKEGFNNYAEVREVLTDDFSVRYFDDIITFLSDNQHLIINALEGAEVNLLAGETARSNYIPDDNNEGTIDMVGNAEQIEFDFADASYIGDGKIVIPVSFESECYVDYYIFKMDYYSIDEKRIKHIGISDWNKHYYHAEEELPLEVKGDIVIEMSIDANALDSIDVKALIEDAVISYDTVNEISVSGYEDYDDRGDYGFYK